MCRCQPGFKGPHCEINVDDCASNPCRNAGTCVDSINDYTCRCTLGFTGKDCGARSDACSLVPCKNGGTCYTHFSGPVCQCRPGFMGPHCEYIQPPTRVPIVYQTDGVGFSVALVISFTLGLITLALVLCAAVILLRQMRLGDKSSTASVCNDLESNNKRNSMICNTPTGRKEKEAFLIPGIPYKMSNKDVALSSNLEDKSNNKQKMLDYNLSKDQKLMKDKLDL